jgi:hypothetical protein
VKKLNLSNTETLIVCVIGVAIGVAIAETVLALVVALAALLVIFTIARGTMRVHWTRRGARTAVEIRDGRVTIHTTREKKPSQEKVS